MKKLVFLLAILLGSIVSAQNSEPWFFRCIEIDGEDQFPMRGKIRMIEGNFYLHLEGEILYLKGLSVKKEPFEGSYLYIYNVLNKNKKVVQLTFAPSLNSVLFRNDEVTVWFLGNGCEY